jgi:hypothetical protein
MSISRSTLLAAVAIASLLATTARADDLAAAVAGRLRDSGALTGYRVNVKAKSGTVWLEGQVADDRQLAAAVGIAESSPGVERVVNRLVIDASSRGTTGNLGMPRSAWSAAGAAPPAATPRKPTATDTRTPLASVAGGLFTPTAPSREDVKLVQAVTPADRARASAARPGRQPLPLASVSGRQGPMTPPRAAPGGVRTAGLMGGMPMGGAGGYDGPMMDGQMVPGTMRITEGGPVHGGMPGGGMVNGGMAGGPDGGYAGGYAGGPMAMGGTGVGMPPVPMRGDGPNMPNYAWPSYSAYPNYAALQYPTQYSPTAWPYIGPFYPYPQVPLGWRRVSLEWDDGWWWLDFDERHIHNHHR